METFKLTIASPEGNIFSEDVERITLRGALGDLAIMARHEPFMTTIQKCTVKIMLPEGNVKTGETEGGILTVGADGEATVISGSFRFTCQEK